MRIAPTDRPDGRDPAGRAEPADGGEAGWIGRHQAAVWRYLRFLGCPPGLAEDLTQDAFLAAIEHRIATAQPATTAAWLRTTARNLWYMHLRSQRRQPVIRDIALADEVFQRHLGDEEHGDRYMTALDHCMHRLDDRQRRALQLRYADGASRAAMATALGIGEAGVKAFLRRVRDRLRQCMRARLQQEGR